MNESAFTSLIVVSCVCAFWVAAKMASATIFVLDIVVTLALCALAFRHYGRFSRNWVVTIIVLWTWFLSSAIVFILPLDISSVRGTTLLLCW